MVSQDWGLPNGFPGTCDGEVIFGNVSEGCLKTIPNITSPSNPPADAPSASALAGFPPWGLFGSPPRTALVAARGSAENDELKKN